MQCTEAGAVFISHGGDKLICGLAGSLSQNRFGTFHNIA
jgi:hypothetical protein